MASATPWINDEKKLKEVCDKLPALMANGESVAEVAVSFGIAKSTFYLNLEKHPELQEAYNHAKTNCEAWWQKLGRAGAAGKVKIQPNVFLANMNNRFNWSDKQTVDHQSSDASMTPKAYSPEQYSAAQSAVSDKLDNLD
tara:strand:+ start:5623 stop:6042 length:420 start_codon:yes stop_codon:yes gene_type:complete